MLTRAIFSSKLLHERVSPSLKSNQFYPSNPPPFSPSISRLVARTIPLNIDVTLRARERNVMSESGRSRGTCRFARSTYRPSGIDFTNDSAINRQSNQFITASHARAFMTVTALDEFSRGLRRNMAAEKDDAIDCRCKGKEEKKKKKGRSRK